MHICIYTCQYTNERGNKEVYGNTKDDDNNLFVARDNNYALQTNDNR